MLNVEKYLLANINIAIDCQAGNALEQGGAEVGLHAEPPLVPTPTATRRNHQREQAHMQRRENVHVRQRGIVVEPEGQEDLAKM